MSVADRAEAIARSWIGTPYAHQASVRGAGSDCLGLFRGIWRDLYDAEPCAIPAYTADWTESGTQEPLWRGLAALMPTRPADAAGGGGVILFRIKSGAVAKHLGIRSRNGLIHAYWGHGVIESRYGMSWARRAVASFAFPDRSE